MVDVPSREEFDTLAARVTALEAGGGGGGGGISADGAKVTAPNQVLVTDDGTSWQLSGPTDNMAVQFKGKDATAWAAAGNTSKVTLLEKWKTDIYQSSPNASKFSTPGWWKGVMMSATAFGSWSDTPGDPSITPAPPTGVFTVDVHGFKDGTGKAWRARGTNGSSRDARDAFNNIFNQLPGMTIYRLTSGANESDTDIADSVQKYNSKGCVVLIEDHSGNRRDINWYTKIANTYKSNNMVMIGVPNEPGGDVSNDQIAVINAVKGAGYKGLIGLQVKGGYDYSSIDPVLSACGKEQLFLTPHIYYAGNDPNGGEQYITNDINGATQRGLWCVFTEFGDAMDGWHRDQYGLKLVSSVIQAEKDNRCGALFWAMDNDNHPDGTCSILLHRDASELTPVGHDPIKPWLSL